VGHPMFCCWDRTPQVPPLRFAPVGMTKGRIAFSFVIPPAPASRGSVADLSRGAVEVSAVLLYWGKAKVNRSLPDAMATYCVPPTA
jgi:hypothetical protein